MQPISNWSIAIVHKLRLLPSEQSGNTLLGVGSILLYSIIKRFARAFVFFGVGSSGSGLELQRTDVMLKPLLVSKLSASLEKVLKRTKMNIQGNHHSHLANLNNVCIFELKCMVIFGSLRAMFYLRCVDFSKPNIEKRRCRALNNPVCFL